MSMRVEQSQQSDVVKARSGLADAPTTAFASVLAAASPAEKPIPTGPRGETTRAVAEHPAYVEVTSGPRSGMFINTTSNERRGEAFVLVRRDDRDLHIYGTGKDRRVIVSWHKDPKPATGGTAAP